MFKKTFKKEVSGVFPIIVKNLRKASIAPPLSVNESEALLNKQISIFTKTKKMTKIWKLGERTMIVKTHWVRVKTAYKMYMGLAIFFLVLDFSFRIFVMIYLISKPNIGF